MAAYIRPRFEGKRQESFLAILLDGQNRLLAERVIAEGIPTQATVYVRRVMEEALRVSASAGLTRIEQARGFLEKASLSENWVREMGNRALDLEAYRDLPADYEADKAAEDIVESIDEKMNKE